MKHLLNAFRVLPSTRSYFKEAHKTKGFDLLTCIHGYVYARWPYFYIGIGTGERRVIQILRPLINYVLKILAYNPADKPKVEDGGLNPTAAFVSSNSTPVTFADTYHGKVIRLDSAQKLVTVKEEINLTDLETVVPYSLARDLILRHPDHILLLQCPCRSVRPNPCLPMDVCLIVGEPFAGFAAEHHPTRSRWITSQEAIDVLRAAENRGNTHHAFFKEAMLGRFYAICNCCSCCCGAMQAYRNGIPMLASSGYIAQIDDHCCIGCGTCVEVCQYQALTLANGSVCLNVANCMGCGLCESRCAQEAISLVRDPAKSDPLELDELVSFSNSAL